MDQSLLWLLIDFLIVFALKKINKNALIEFNCADLKKKNNKQNIYLLLLVLSFFAQVNNVRVHLHTCSGAFDRLPPQRAHLSLSSTCLNFPILFKDFLSVFSIS